MFKEIGRKFRDWKDENVEASMLQKGLTLVELLVVVVILGIIAAILVLAVSNIFGKVDGTELVQDSKKMETAVLQGTFANAKRTVPGVTSEPVDALATKFDADGKWGTGTTVDFSSAKDAARVLNAVASSIGVVGFEGNDLAALLAPVDKVVVGEVVGGRVKSEKYFVVLNKNQVFKEGALDAYSNYKDELAGRVISLDTIIDSDGNYFNGSFEIKASTMKDFNSSAPATVFSVPNGTTVTP